MKKFSKGREKKKRKKEEEERKADCRIFIRQNGIQFVTIEKIVAFVRISYVRSSLKFEAVVHLLNARTPFYSLFSNE